ncbi:hypothetical protein OROMI_005816 [Orobanche minor]
MKNLSLISLLRCFNGCRDHTQVSGRHGTRFWNLTDNPIELQIRVGSTLKRVHTLKPGSSKRLKRKNIYKAYMPGIMKANNINKGSLLYYNHDETYDHPYIWIHDTVCDFSRMGKQQYISLDDLIDFSEISVFTDRQRGRISVCKKSRREFC